jgi:hypothetical protein
MALCSRGVTGCHHEFRIATSQKHDAFKRASRTGPYGEAKVFPYIWTVDNDNTLRLEMGPNYEGHSLVAVFRHEQILLQIGVLVHVSVYMVIDPTVKDWSAMPVKLVEDTRAYVEALNHYKGAFLGIRGIFVPQITNVPPPQDDE